MLSKIFPFLIWFRDYDINKLKIDFIAGLTVALVLIPQSMAYAQLAGLPPYYGLYAAFLPPMIASLFGSSRQLATGPVAVVSLMTAASLEPIATAGSDAFIAYAVLLALTVGIFQLTLGVLKLGLIVSILSHPVVNGFTNAAAIIIASSQLSKLFGVYVDKAPHHYETIIRVCRAALDYTHLPTLGMGILAILIMVILKRINPRIPNVLVAVVVTIFLSVTFKFENNVTVPVSSIKAPEIVSDIREFNHAVSMIVKLGEERAMLNKEKEISQGNSKHHILSKELLNLKYEISLIEMEITENKHLAHVKRKKLRETRLIKNKTSDGPAEFYTQKTKPGEFEADSHKWRIKVGNKKLKEDKLLIIGAGAVVGKIPEGLPKFAIPAVEFKTLFQLLPFAVIISLLGFMEAIAIAKAMAAKTGQKLDPNQELIGQGLSNIIGSIGSSYPVSGSFSRSAVNLQAGAITGVSSVVTSLIVVVTLLFLTPLLYHLPQAVLAAVIMMAVIGLVNASGFIHAWKAKKYDGIISIITFICTLYFAPHLHYGIMVGVALTLAVFMYKSMRPEVARLSKAEDNSLRSMESYGLQECDHISVVRYDGALIFANATYLEDKITEIMGQKPNLRHILVEASGMNDIDASGEDALAILVDTVRSKYHEISFCGVKEKVMDVLIRTHLIDKIGEENVYPTLEIAIDKIFENAHEGTETERGDICPLIKYTPV